MWDSSPLLCRWTMVLEHSHSSYCISNCVFVLDFVLTSLKIYENNYYLKIRHQLDSNHLWIMRQATLPLALWVRSAETSFLILNERKRNKAILISWPAWLCIAPLRSCSLSYPPGACFRPIIIFSKAQDNDLSKENRSMFETSKRLFFLGLISWGMNNNSIKWKQKLVLV